jgi:hypothetical protein
MAIRNGGVNGKIMVEFPLLSWIPGLCTLNMGCSTTTLRQAGYLQGLGRCLWRQPGTGAMFACFRTTELGFGVHMFDILMLWIGMALSIQWL